MVNGSSKNLGESWRVPPVAIFVESIFNSIARRDRIEWKYMEEPAQLEGAMGPTNLGFLRLISLKQAGDLP